MNKFCGIDLHSNNGVVVVSDEADRVVYQRRLPNDAAQIRAALALQREDLVGVVVEATFNWYWLVDELMNDGYCVHLANPAVMQTLQEQIAALEKRLMERVKLNPDYALLNSVPGIGPVLATTIMLETGNISRFADVGNFSSYCRCVDSRRESNSRKKGEGNTKNGNRYLAWAFVEAANFAIRTCPEARRFYERKKRSRNGIVAIKALAHKLARACYRMLREHKPFEVSRGFG